MCLNGNAHNVRWQVLNKLCVEVYDTQEYTS